MRGSQGRRLRFPKRMTTNCFMHATLQDCRRLQHKVFQFSSDMNFSERGKLYVMFCCIDFVVSRNINFWLPSFGENVFHSKRMSSSRLRRVPAQFDRSQENAYSAAELPHRPVEQRSAEKGLFVSEEQPDFARDSKGRLGRRPRAASKEAPEASCPDS